MPQHDDKDDAKRAAGSSQTSHAEVFDEIYRSSAWGIGSGSGSTELRTRSYRNFLQSFMALNRVSSVLDLGCGDWQFSEHIDWSSVHYTGIDVSNVVLVNTKRFSRDGIEFLHLDACVDPLPNADLLIAKDVFQHWSNQDVSTFLPRLQGFRFALITNGFATSGDHRTNTDIQPGRWRPIDVSTQPFNLPGAYVFEFVGDEPKQTFLWCNPILT